MTADPQYPNGKLNEEDDGALSIAIGTEKGCVKVVFHEPAQWFAMPPDLAIQFAETVIAHARELQSVAKDRAG